MREKKIYCGKNYLEVDIYPYTYFKKGKNGKRSKKVKESKPKQNNLNDKNARRYFAQLVQANFNKHDLHVTATYKDKFLPSTLEEGEKEVINFLRRISYRRKKEGLEPLKYILVTEYSTEEDEGDVVRIHHHMIINGGLDRDEIEKLWSKRKKKGESEGEKIGYINADRLQTEDNGLEALCKYLTKYPKKKKRWSSSKNLIKPISRINDCKYGKRQIERIAKNTPDKNYWEKKYKGWVVIEEAIKVQYNEHTGWSIYLKMFRKENT